ncbi:MAG: transport permease protein [Betaproteobacteria bacterium]|nr:MAG: transport permease protein [Betaproteobacteria bacterium]
MVLAKGAARAGTPTLCCAGARALYPARARRKRGPGQRRVARVQPMLGCARRLAGGGAPAGGAAAGNPATSMSYLADVWRARFFWSHLALADLRQRWRRSFLGALWSIIQPLGMTILLTLVFSRIFGADVTRYAPFIFSGMITWEYVVSTVSGGSLAFVQADAYIRQTRRPLAIYTLRTAVTNLIVFAFASTGLIVWSVAVMPGNVGWSWFAALAVFPVLLAIGWAVATFLAYFATRFRDIPHALGLMLQALWFVSPVYFEPDVFRKAGLSGLVDWNPIHHLLEIVRAPLLRGQWPTAANFAWAAGLAAGFGVAAWLAGRRLERKVIFYL